MATDLVGDVASRKDIPAHARFERRSVEDKAASVAAGRYVANDVDYAIITAPYSDGKENLHIKVSQWFENMEHEVKARRLPVVWVERYREAYTRWLNGQEMPLHGTPIKGWGVISPAQQDMLIRMLILTVEELAGVNDVGMKHIGMGALDLKNKAKAWLAQLGDKGPLTLEMAALQRENEVQKGQIATLSRQVEELVNQIKALPSTSFTTTTQPVEVVETIVDILSKEPEPVKRGPGRPRKVA